VELEYLSRGKGVRQEKLVAKVLALRGNHPELVHGISVMEACTTFKPWHDKATGKTGLKMVPGKCATYSFYPMDPHLGLMYVRGPTWLPCRLQIYFNVHHWLAAKLQAEGIDFEMEDNAFVGISDWKRAQELASGFSVKEWEMKFHALVASFCPAVEKSLCGYHWSVMQVEHSLDVVFKKREVLVPLYEEIGRQAVVAVWLPDMARF
jgi:hypothetical protein